jgi:hypothetical protein
VRWARAAVFSGLFLQPSAAPFVVVDVSEPLMPAFFGFLFGLAVVGGPDAGWTAKLLVRAPEPLVAERVLDPDAMCLRDLRRLPSIGPARSLAIVRARFEAGLSGGPRAWARIEGIGPETVRSAGAWIDAARAARLSAPVGGAYTSSANDPGSPPR